MNSQRDFSDLRQYSDARIGGLVGLLIGDALGVPYEFKSPEQLPPYEEIEMTPPAKFRRSHAGVPVGTWSDDGSQALCLLASLLDCGRLSLADFSDRLVRWADEGYMAVDGDVFDTGIQTSRALDRLRDGVSPREAGGADERDNGNGSLMRVLPLALWHAGPDRAVVGAAHISSLPTHAHPRSLVACAFYSLVARAYLWKIDDPWSWANEHLGAVYQRWSVEREPDSTFLAELDLIRRFMKTETPRGSGYVLDTLLSARTALEQPTFEDVAKAAIQFGNDTDTTAAVACGLAGIKFGLEGIPARWLQHLRGYDLAGSLLTTWINRPMPEWAEEDEWAGVAVDGVPILLIDWSEARERRRRKQ